MSKQKVLFISNHAGFSKFNIAYLNLLLNNDIKTFNASPGIESEFNGTQINIPISRSPMSFKNIKAFIILLKAIKIHKIENIHCHTPTGGFLGRVLKIFNPNLKIIYTAHGYHFFKGASLSYWFVFFPVEYILSFLTDAIVVINREDYLITKSKFKCKTYMINGVGLDLNKFNLTERAAKLKLIDQQELKDKLIFIYAGQFIKRKNHLFLLKAFKEYLSKINTNAHLLLAGDGPELNTIQKKSKDLDLESNITFLGYQRNIEDYYKISDVVISVSKQEGFGMNLVEGLGCGLTMMASNVRGHRDIFLQTSGHHMFDLNEESIYDTFKNLNPRTLKDPETKRMNRTQAEIFGIENSVNKMKEVYNQEFNLELK